MKLLLYPDTTHPRYKISQIKAYIEYLGIELTDRFDVLMYQSYHRTVRKHDKFITDMKDTLKMIGIDMSRVWHESRRTRERNKR